MHVAWVARVPHGRDADLGLVHILFAHTGRVEHSLRGALRLGLRDVLADRVELIVGSGGADGGAGERSAGGMLAVMKRRSD